MINKYPPTRKQATKSTKSHEPTKNTAKALASFPTNPRGLLIPIPNHLRDGGTVEYKALLYKISKVHRLVPLEENKEYDDGIIIEILGFEIYNNVK